MGGKGRDAGGLASGPDRVYRGATAASAGVGRGLDMFELLIVLVIVVLLFGAAKLPGLGQGLGKAVRNFRQAASGAGEERPPKGELPRPPKPPADAGG